MVVGIFGVFSAPETDLSAADSAVMLIAMKPVKATRKPGRPPSGKSAPTVRISPHFPEALAERVRFLPRWVWAVACLFCVPLGGILYLLIGRVWTHGATR